MQKVYRFLGESHVEKLALCEVVTHKCSELSEESYVKNRLDLHTDVPRHKALRRVNF